MKSLFTVVILFALAIVATAVWYSPLTKLGKPYEYENNLPVAEIDGLCYAPDTLARVDFEGGESELYKALDIMCAQVIKTVECGGAIIVYASSSRVCARGEKLASGETYNVMAAVRDGTVSIGTPLLSGCY